MLFLAMICTVSCEWTSLLLRSLVSSRTPGRRAVSAVLAFHGPSLVLLTLPDSPPARLDSRLTHFDAVRDHACADRE